ncbi:hypothetical protein DRJ17_00510 [Candidatus Woesearchaeota archaeon]|nr:MAG: hypothetical protein DRJ17_00510 [Candidatus Woesearchaeota archaeon]
MCENCGCGCERKDVDCCESCGMPMESVEMRGGAKPDNKYCKYCCDENGNLKSKEEVRKGMIEFYKAQGKSQEEAEKFVDDYMKKMPAWKEGKEGE